MAQIAADSHIAIVIGRTDTGKSTFCRQLASIALEKGRKVAIVDSDVGQSWIGPPTTIGMKMVHQDFESSLFPDAFYFVGNISPYKCLLQIVIGTKLMVEEAISSGAELVIIDTTGLVDGNIGKVLKTSKIELIRPDHIIFFQRGSELEVLIKGFETNSHYRIHRLSPSKEVTRKSQEWRREYRQKQFEQYFSDFVSRDFSFTQLRSQRSVFLNGRKANDIEIKNISDIAEDVVLYAEWFSKGLFIVTPDELNEITARKICDYFSLDDLITHTLDDFQHLLTALLDEHGKPICLAIIEKIDFEQGILTLKCSQNAPGLAKVLQLSNFRL